MGYVEDAFEGRTPHGERRVSARWGRAGEKGGFISILLDLALEQVSEMGEGREGRRSILLPARRRLTRRVSHLIPLVLIVVAVETEQLPVAPVGWIVVMVVVLVMDRELAQLLAVKFASAVSTDPRKHFERVLSIGLLQLSLGAPCHASLQEDGDSLLSDSTTSLSRMLKLVCFVYLVHLVCLA
jgi:TRAP-type uncharacterized transport system fused permease subunit